MVKKKASLAGRGAEILFGAKGPPPAPEPLTNDAQTNETLESDQKDDTNAGERTSSTPAPANLQPRPLTNTAAPLEVGPDRPAPVRNVLPPGTVVNVNPSATPTVAPARTYDIPPPSDFESDPAGGASISGAPTATVPPPRANNMTVGTTPVATPTSQPAITPGGNVSNPSGTPPSRGTSVVSPTTTGPQT